jgi:hypothetical protein
MLRTGAAKNPSCLVSWVLALVPWLAACGSEAAPGGSESDTGTTGENPGGTCRAAEPSEPLTRQARVEVIATGQGTIGTWSPLEMPALFADASGVYWADTDGAVYARQGGGDVVTLQPGHDSEDVARRQHVVGLTADAERIYVGNAFLEPSVDFFPGPQFIPPGRLLSYPKRGGPPAVLIELEDSTIYPFAVDGDRIIALVAGPDGNGGYFQVNPSDPQLERLQMRLTPGGYLELDGNTLYWSDDEYPPNLVRTGFDDPEPEVVRGLLSNDFEVGPGYVLSIEEHFFSKQGRVAQNFVRHGAATDPDRPLPSAGQLISLKRALDARHVYWYDYRGYDGSIPVEEYDPSLQLVRADVVCGTLERLATPGLVPDGSAEIVGQYGDTLYIKSGNELFAVQKP